MIAFCPVCRSCHECNEEITIVKELQDLIHKINSIISDVTPKTFHIHK